MVVRHVFVSFGTSGDSPPHPVAIPATAAGTCCELPRTATATKLSLPLFDFFRRRNKGSPPEVLLFSSAAVPSSSRLVRECLRSSLLLFALFVSMLYAYLYKYYYTCALYILLGTYPKIYSIREVRGSRPIPGLVRGSRPIPGLVTSAAYTTKSALLFVVQVLIRSLLV
ncbi:hypothetical protein LXL04_012440 [Taraxacum kok-saghyz]